MIETPQNFIDFELACSAEAEVNKCYLLANEDFNINNSFIKRTAQDMMRFIDVMKRKNISSRVAKMIGLKREDRHKDIIDTKTGLLDAERGSKLTTKTDIYNMLSERCGDNVLKNIKAFRSFVGTYVSEHMTELSFRGPGNKLVWVHDEEFFKICGVKKEDIMNAIKSSEYIKPNWMIANKPINMFMAFLCFFLYNNISAEEKKAINDPKKYKTTNCYLANLILCIRFYSSINYKYFPNGVKEDLMNKTIEELSDRYTFSSLSNIFEYLNNTAASNLLNAVKLYNKPTDYNINYFMDNLNSRINTVIKGIASAYYENVNNGVEVVTDKFEITNEEGDTMINIPQTISSDIENLVRKLAIKLSSNSQVIEKYLYIACKETRQGVSRMKSTIQLMIDDDKELIIDLMRKIITYYLGYLKKDKKTIRSINFISLMKKTYNVSNTVDKGLIDIKESLNKLLANNSKEYLKTNRAAALSNMKACVFYYWLLYINDKVEG